MCFFWMCKGSLTNPALAFCRPSIRLGIEPGGAGLNSSPADDGERKYICVALKPEQAFRPSLPARGERAGERGFLARRIATIKNPVLHPVSSAKPVYELLLEFALA